MYSLTQSSILLYLEFFYLIDVMRSKINYDTDFCENKKKTYINKWLIASD